MLRVDEGGSSALSINRKNSYFLGNICQHTEENNALVSEH